ncbi:MAG: DNA mismatch repair protein MutS [Thermodesulfobacteriota bacterium]|nr:DNA mismatch repair protein MutS [Thermodesulfobacteriota bacterium]
MNSLTPMIKQYLSVKEKYPDAILFYRLGDFYEMFFEDAKLASEILDITLTSRDKNKEDSVPLCGVPYHAASSYIQKLIDQGYKVAICEQMEEASKAKGIVRREVIRVITPGMMLEDDYLQPKANNFLMAISLGEERFGLAILDASTGDFLATEVNTAQSLLDEVMRTGPKEIIFPANAKEQAPVKHLMKAFPQALYSPLPPEVFDGERSKERMKALGLLFPEGKNQALQAVGGILFYVEETQKVQPGHLSRLELYQVQDYMVLDETTRKNLEIFENLATRSRKGSLLEILDETVTSMGGRMLKRWLSSPLMDLDKINERLNKVSELKEKDLSRQRLRETMRQVKDIERLSARISLGIANARDLVSLKFSLNLLPEIKSIISLLEQENFKRYLIELDELPEIKNLLEKAIEENPPLTLKEGGLIKKEFDAALDRLREISREGKRWIADLETKERMRTGISSLKVRYNKVFGYYIEVTKANLPAVPSHYMRKQTLSNAERFITQELQEYETQVLTAEEQKDSLEYQIFLQILGRVAAQVRGMQRTAQALAEMDVLSALAEIAEHNGYCRPSLDEGDTLKIEEGRHPVLERLALEERFVPNDLFMDNEERQILIITGPNMAGKSTIMRQTALIGIMAQMGSFVPAREAHLGLIDRIFTRVGASDDLARGRSTFMVEMEEMAHILRNITPRSLILLDEIGRGTSTFDGLSIAWAVTEYLHEGSPWRAKTLFATHYHELTELALTKPRVKNFHVAVKEWNDRVIFLRKLVEGGTSRSYGIQVARLAGLPQAVIDRAKEVLLNLEQGEFTEGGVPKLAVSRKKKAAWDSLQMTLFQKPPDSLRETLKKIDPDRLTPLEALTLLSEMKSRLSSEVD